MKKCAKCDGLKLYNGRSEAVAISHVPTSKPITKYVQTDVLKMQD